MSEELSRVKSRRKSADHKSSDRKKRSAAGTNQKQTTAVSPEVRQETAEQPAGLSRKARHGAAASPVKPDRQKQTATQETEDTPSRSQSYPSERLRLSKIFVNSLYVLFILLLGFLIWWGINDAPALRTLW
ncbi:hypothetical protein [Paenibacillus sp. FSL R7-0331]|uniref:hypothetical protein n=1 Tax=Paenibacillus sp. FSL R7-0331 TaxID=1536773 RepID=UPI0005A7971E|nr:hypothetical protein [Paenibacillus sp. FSL R7-0331]